MLLMDIITWEPKDSAKVGELYENYEYPTGMKVIDEWIDLTGYRMFVIYETESEKIFAPSISPFIGLCRFETIPVMEADKYMQVTREYAEETGGRKTGAEQGKISTKNELLEQIKDQIENLEKRVQRLEHHSFVQQEDVT
jgi:hypothetical protein